MNVSNDQLKAVALRRRLGDYFLKQELLTKDQLEEAVEYQCIYGGKLGTSLVELGYINEIDLAKVLSQQLKLHYINPELLMKVPPEILQLVPQDIAINYKVVPYHLENNRLYLAMGNASDLAEIDALAFQLDQIIVPLAIPEVRLMLALKKHYGLALTPRFETLASQLKKRRLAEKKQRKPKAEAEEQIEEENWPLLGESDELGDAEQEDAYFSTATPATEISFTSLCQQLANAADRNDIAKALIHFLGQEFTVSALFMVRQSGASGWMAQQNGEEPNGFHQFNLPLQEDSVLKMAIENHSHYLGRIPNSGQNLRLLQLFSPAPPSALVVPLMVRDRIVSILYVQDQLETLEKSYAELQALVHKAELSFMLLIMKNKILTI